MPSKRSSNAAKNKKNNSSRQAQSRAAQAAAADFGGLTTAQSDIIGVVLAVLAIAMFISVVAPSTAPVTSAMGHLLGLGFGTGAVLVPVALFVFAMTFFTADEGPISGRVAAGLVLIVVAVLAMISLNQPAAAAAPERLITDTVAVKAGGYVGGGIACVLATYLGVIVGNVVLVGIIVAGLVVCGFSITDVVARVSARAAAASEARRFAAEQRAQERAVTRDATVANDKPRRFAKGSDTSVAKQSQASLFDETGEGQTTFIGERKTSVLKRNKSVLPSLKTSDFSFNDDPDEREGAAPAVVNDSLFAPDDVADLGEKDPEPKTSLLSRKKKGKSGKAAKAAAAAVDEAFEDMGDAPVFETPFDDPAPAAGASGDAKRASQQEKADNIPDFLRNPKSTKAAAVEAPAELTRPGDADESYELPPLSILRQNDANNGDFGNDEELTRTAQKLQATLEEFGLGARVTGWTAGPSVTTFKIAMGEGERVNKIVNLEDDIALSLAAKSVRIFSPIPGTSLVGIEIPNEKSQPVYLSDVLPFAQGGPLECAFGRDSEGKPIVVDLAGLPHLLVAGTTGSGKSVLLNSIIMSMLMRATPEQVRLIMVDPKRVEFTGYAGLPHLYVPVVTEPRQAASALQWGVTEMERRLKVFEHYKVRDIKTYNGNVDGGKYADMENPPKHMPYFVIVIDELADLMMVAGKDVETSIVRIAQLGRAAGIHLIVATQRPSADVVTGLIRANIDNRVALSVDNSLNSRIILDQKGAEQLLGRGDMLVKLRGKKPRRAQGCWVSDDEIEQTVKFVREQVTADYHEDILTAVVPNAPGAPGSDAPKEDDPLVWQAAQLVVESQLGSTSGLQRALSVGYARAGRIMDMLEAKGVVGPANGSKPRDVLIDMEGLEELKTQDAIYQGVE